MIKEALKLALASSDLDFRIQMEMSNLSKSELSQFKHGKKAVSFERALEVSNSVGMGATFADALRRLALESIGEKSLL